MIKLHETRHTAATPGLEAGLNMKIVSTQFAHSTTTTTRTDEPGVTSRVGTPGP
ncbi:hypothetical protein ACFY05_25925 [Microtetraspora fusca]|uniref:Integrase n=1 Tax=Microtetraspora fusca TaxID=1997 RepID=A0ABW6VES8_MICFU